MVFHKVLLLPHHTHTSYSTIRSIPSAKTYTYTLNKHKHISYLIKKIIFLPSLWWFWACPLLLSAGNPGGSLKEKMTELWVPKQSEDFFPLFFMTFQEILKQWSCSKALQEMLCLRKLLLCFNGLNLSQWCLI